MTPIGSFYAAIMAAVGVHANADVGVVTPGASLASRILAGVWCLVGRPCCIPFYTAAKVVGALLYGRSASSGASNHNPLPSGYLATGIAETGEPPGDVDRDGHRVA